MGEPTAAPEVLPGLPHLRSGISWELEGRPVLATPNLKEGVVSIIDTKGWLMVKQIQTLGPGFFLRSHENTPYARVDALQQPAERCAAGDRQRTLELARTLRREPGKSAAHVEFTRDGRYTPVSLWEMDGALIVYDAATLKEVKRLPGGRRSSNSLRPIECLRELARHIGASPGVDHSGHAVDLNVCLHVLLATAQARLDEAVGALPTLIATQLSLGDASADVVGPGFR